MLALDALETKQRTRLKLGEHAGLTTSAQVASFVETVGVALRYGPSDTLPLASMYQAIWRLARTPEPERGAQRRATVLTNGLIEAGTVIETTVVAERVAVAHVSIAPALIALCRRGRTAAELGLSDTARRVLEFVTEAERPTAGQVRALLRVPPKTWPNPADDALAELQRWLLIDRGAADVPETGSPYLSKDGIPYRVVDRAHPALVRAAGRLAVDAAALIVIGAYLDGAVFAARKKLASLVKRCLTAGELDHAIARLADGGRVRVERVGGKDLIIAR